MTKSDILQKIRDELRSQYQRVAGAATEARDYATDEGSKAEGKYDTRGLEASYLAAGQAAKADELAEAIGIFTTLKLPDFEADDPIAIGALVALDFEGAQTFYLLAPRGGGIACDHDGVELTVLTPSAPLFEKLEGLRAGDAVPDSPMTVVSVS